jgi:hypothetical protein
MVLFFGLNNLTSSQAPEESSKAPTDTTIDLTTEYTIVYPGTDNNLITVWIRNPQDSIGSYNLSFTIGYSVIGYFSTDSLGDCVIETTGCLASYTVLDSCSCYSDDCYAIEHAAHVPMGSQAIPPDPNWTCLFKLNMDACCIPDSATVRDAYIYISGQLFNQNGYQIPYHTYNSQVQLWWSVAGDANGDSAVNVGDVTFLTDYLFRGGPEPCICEAADCNADTTITVADQVYLINYLYRGGAEPLRGEYACWHSDCRPE